MLYKAKKRAVLNKSRPVTGYANRSDVVLDVARSEKARKICAVRKRSALMPVGIKIRLRSNTRSGAFKEVDGLGTPQILRGRAIRRPSRGALGA